MTLAESDLQHLSQTATHAATHAGQYIQSQVVESHHIRGKARGDTLASQVVTAVDLHAQTIILDYLKPAIQQFDLGLLTEESIDDQSRQTKDYFWCVDPLDGTLPFTEKRPGYAVSIALVSRAGDPVIGAVYLPNLQQCYTAIKGEGVLLNDQQFFREVVQEDQKFHWYMDRSFLSTGYFEEVKSKVQAYATAQPLELVIHPTYGAVANAIGVMTSKTACYFKFPKKSNGGGSIWDYAATRLMFEELDLHVSNSMKEKLHLNDPETTFMNRQGVTYATMKESIDFIDQD